MRKCYLDSNILLYLKNASSPHHRDAVEITQKLIAGSISLYVSSLVLDEFMHTFLYEVRRNGSKNPYNDLQTAVEDIVELPELSIVNPPSDPESHVRVVGLMKQYALHPRDAYHLLTMIANDIDGFATFDTDFTRVFAANLLMKASPISSFFLSQVFS